MDDAGPYAEPTKTVVETKQGLMTGCGVCSVDSGSTKTPTKKSSLFLDEPRTTVWKTSWLQSNVHAGTGRSLSFMRSETLNEIVFEMPLLLTIFAHAAVPRKKILPNCDIFLLKMSMKVVSSFIDRIKLNVRADTDKKNKGNVSALRYRKAKIEHHLLPGLTTLLRMKSLNADASCEDRWSCRLPGVNA